MTVNDLMFWDLILLNSEPTEVTLSLLEELQELDNYEIVSPIELSLEFFKKNGFTKDGDYWRIPGLTGGFRLFQWGNGSWSIEDHVLIEVRFVHELQRIFKMIGLKIKLVV